jgi:hypothetical protein
VSSSSSSQELDTTYIPESLFAIFVPTFVFGLVVQNSTLSETNANVTVSCQTERIHGRYEFIPFECGNSNGEECLNWVVFLSRMNCGDNHPAPIMAEVTILTPNNVRKRHHHQHQQQQDVLMMSSLSDDFARQLSSSSSPLVAVDGRMTDDNDDHQHFEDEPTLQSPSASGAQHLDVIISAGGHQQSDDTGTAQQRHSSADKGCHYSDDEDDDEDDDEEEEEHEEEQDALVRASRLSRRHSSAGAVPMSLTVLPSNVFTDVYKGGTSVTGRGLVRERSAPTRRCRIEEEQQQQQPRNQSATSSARPAGAINNNVAGNWLNVPGAADSSGKKKNKTASSGRNNVSIERLELVPASPMRNKSPSGALGSLAAPGRRLQQNNSFGGTASELLHHRPSNPSLESSAGQTSTNKESLRHHRPSSTSQHHHVRSQSVRVAPRSTTTTTTTTSNRNNNISSSINQPKLLADYNSVQQHQQSIKVRPRGTSLPGTNRVDPATTAINAEEQQQQQQHYYGNNQQTVGGEGDEADYYLLRHFIVHGKSNKVVNRGDSFRRSLRSHKQQQQQSGGAISQHSSTSSIRYT